VGDDEPNVRNALADLLRLLGHEVALAHDGRSTIATFQVGEFDMIFTDLGMPDCSGWEVAEAIRRLDRAIPIVLATGWGAEIEEEEAARRGVTRVLSKPFTIQKISSLIAELQSLSKAA
jgi:CheY-like chemotaxis protein